MQVKYYKNDSSKNCYWRYNYAWHIWYLWHKHANITKITRSIQEKLTVENRTYNFLF